MGATRMKIAKLEEAQLLKLQALEEELGTYVVALEPRVRLAKLSEEQIQKLQALEREIGVVLLAYERD